MSFSLDIWTVYNHPTDYPDKWVARRWVVRSDSPGPLVTGEVEVRDDLMEIRDAMQRKGLTYIPRYRDDDPTIFECWI